MTTRQFHYPGNIDGSETTFSGTGLADLKEPPTGSRISFEYFEDGMTSNQTLKVDSAGEYKNIISRKLGGIDEKTLAVLLQKITHHKKVYLHANSNTLQIELHPSADPATPANEAVAKQQPADSGSIASRVVARRRKDSNAEVLLQPFYTPPKTRSRAKAGAASAGDPASFFSIYPNAKAKGKGKGKAKAKAKPSADASSSTSSSSSSSN